MPSRAERVPQTAPAAPAMAPIVDVHADEEGPESGGREWRGMAEMALHVLAILLLAWVLWRILNPTPPSGARIVTEDQLPAMLRAWTTTDSVAAVHVRFTGAPTGATRDWLHAFPISGTRVSWDRVTGGSLPATAIDVEPVADPHGTIRASVAAPPKSKVILGDELGPIDSAVAPHGIINFRVQPPFVKGTATVDNMTAHAVLPDSLVLHRALVLGNATWEAKFIERALEDEGWGVDVHFAVAPKNDVMTAKLPTLDTAHYSVVVAVDTSLSGMETQIKKFVASGGGLIICSDAVLGLQSLATGLPGEVIRPPSPNLPDSVQQRGLTLSPITQLAEGAVPLEHRDNLVTVAARRVENGRVIQEGYTDTWRWRMDGNDSTGNTDHRNWWSNLAAEVAYAPAVVRSASLIGDPAPLSAMVDRIGPPAEAPPRAAPAHIDLLPLWVFALVIAALLAEWASRRLRGEK